MLLRVQRTCNIKTRRRERVIPQQPSIPIRHPRLPDNSGNATQPLAPIFLPNVPRRQIGHVPASTQITRESVHHAMGIVDDDDDSLELDSSEKQDPVYDSSEDEARLDPKAAAGAEENSNESEGQNPLESQDEIVLTEPAGRRQVRADIYSQISILSVNGCKYFKCNTCPQQYKRSAGTKNICDHLLKRNGWISLTGVQNKRKRENESIKDIIKRMGPAVKERKMQFRKSYSVKVWIRRHWSIFLFRLLYFMIFPLIWYKIIPLIPGLSMSTRPQTTCFQILVQPFELK